MKNRAGFLAWSL